MNTIILFTATSFIKEITPSNFYVQGGILVSLYLFVRFFLYPIWNGYCQAIGENLYKLQTEFSFIRLFIFLKEGIWKYRIIILLAMVFGLVSMYTKSSKAHSQTKEELNKTQAELDKIQAEKERAETILDSLRTHKQYHKEKNIESKTLVIQLSKKEYIKLRKKQGLNLSGRESITSGDITYVLESSQVKSCKVHKKPIYVSCNRYHRLRNRYLPAEQDELYIGNRLYLEAGGCKRYRYSPRKSHVYYTKNCKKKKHRYKKRFG